MGSIGVYEPRFGLGLDRVYAELLQHLAGAMRKNLEAFLKNRIFTGFFVLSFGSFSYLSCKEFVRLLTTRRSKLLLASSTVAASPAPSSSASSSSSSSPSLSPSSSSSRALSPSSLSDNKDKQSVAKPPKSEKIDAKSWKFWSSLLKLCRIALPSLFSKGSFLLLSQFFLLIMRTLLTVRAVKTNVYFLSKAIAGASWRYWSNWVASFCLWMVGSIVVNSGLRWTETQISIEFRKRLTEHAHKQYLACNNFYRLAILKQGNLDNLDGRITSDIELFCRKLAKLYGHSFKPILEFGLSLWEASKDLGLKRPMMLFLCSVVANGVLAPLVPSEGQMIVKEQTLEGNFRRAHTRLIAHAEEIAFLQGSATEKRILDTRLNVLVDTKSRHNLATIGKTAINNFLKFQGLLVGGVFVHVPFLLRSDLSEADRISHFRGTEELMLRCGGAFTEILLLGKSLQEVAGYTHRISELMNALEQGSKQAKLQEEGTQQQQQRQITLDSNNGANNQPAIKFRGVTILAPDANGKGKILVRNLNLNVERGQSCLITGPNGAGKTSLFRVLAGLWTPIEGDVFYPSCRMMWIPQTPYLVTGTLRDQVAYPEQLAFDTQRDEDIFACLRKAGLEALVNNAKEGLSLSHEEWNDVLSGGERQRLGFARLFYHKPVFAVLDEATSSINPEGEHKLYKEVLASNITVFSIAHRLQLRDYHHFELAIKGDGTGEWELSTLRPK